ncbi:hypothetical protein BJX96DRAFT_172356 [Aspergillus floccosus]
MEAPNRLSQQDIDDLLKPDEPFDWADDVEETLAVDESGFSSLDSNIAYPTEDDPPSQLDTLGLRIVDSSLARSCSFSSATTEPLDDVWDANDYTSDDGHSTFATNTTTVSDTSFVHAPGHHVPDDIRSDVYNEFFYRNYYIHTVANEDQVHHFNWMGCPVPHYSETSPAVSLMFMRTAPRVPTAHRDELRYSSILKRATVYIDHVIVSLENGSEDPSWHGYDLVRWATGRVYKFYTGHGSWVQDAREVAEGTVTDNGDFELYTREDIAPENGFLREYGMYCRQQWLHERVQRLEALHSQTFPRRRSAHGTGNKCFAPSPLGRWVTTDDKAPQTTANGTSVLAQRESGPIHDELDSTAQPKPIIAQPGKSDINVREAPKRHRSGPFQSFKSPVDCVHPRHLKKAKASEPSPRLEGFKPSLCTIDELETPIEDNQEPDMTDVPVSDRELEAHLYPDSHENPPPPPDQDGSTRSSRLPKSKSKIACDGLDKARAKWRKFKDGSWSRFCKKTRGVFKPKSESNESEPRPSRFVLKYVLFPKPYHGRRKAIRMLLPPCYRKTTRRGRLFKNLKPDVFWDYSNRVEDDAGYK